MRFLELDLLNIAGVPNSLVQGPLWPFKHPLLASDVLIDFKIFKQNSARHFVSLEHICQICGFDRLTGPQDFYRKNLGSKNPGLDGCPEWSGQ